PVYEALAWIVAWFPVQARCLPLCDGSVEILHIKTEVVDDRADRAAAVVLLAKQNVNARELDHGELFPVEDSAANDRPELLLCLDITRVDVHVADCDTHGIRS